MSEFDLVVIGAGPGGYVAAIRGAQLGMKVACVERGALGGTCLNIGCIPSKALLESSERYHAAMHALSRHGVNVGGVSLDLAKMMGRKDEVVKKNTDGVAYLFKKNKIEHVRGEGTIARAGEVRVGERTLAAKRILIATGSAPIEMPGLKFDGKCVISSTEALALSEVPKKLIVVGGGYIGVEMASVWRRLGAEVLVVEFMERILPPSDREMALALQRLLEKQGMTFRFGTTAQSAKVEGGRVKVALKSGEQVSEEAADKVLVCVGRRPVTEGLGLEKAGVTKSPKGFVQVNERFETNVAGIYAIGDVIGGLMLAHKAEEEGVAAVEGMMGHTARVNYGACPSVVYTHPALAQVGMTEEEAAKRGAIKVGKFPFSANGYARATDETDGLVKVIADAKTDRVLGVHILGAGAATLIAEATLAVEFAAAAEDVARSFHAHPTLAEALKEAAMNVDKGGIHI